LVAISEFHINFLSKNTITMIVRMNCVRHSVSILLLDQLFCINDVVQWYASIDTNFLYQSWNIGLGMLPRL
jgi:hypothetical protein